MRHDAVENRVARPDVYGYPNTMYRAGGPFDRGRRACEETPKPIRRRRSEHGSTGAPGFACRVRNLRSQMRSRWRLCVFVALSLVGLTSARYSGPATASANRGTVPSSSYGGSLVSTPSPVDSTSNLVMTGNVAGGKAFRGSVPYGSTTSFGSPLGSTSLDQFLRNSSIPEGLGGGPSDYSPFYSPTGTVPKIPPGGTGVFAPGSPRIAVGRMASRSDQPTDVITVPPAPQPQVSAGRSNAWGDTSTQTWQGLRPVPLTATPEQMRQILAGVPENPPAGNRPSTQSTQPMSAEEYRRQVDQLQHDLDRVKTNASEFEQSLRTDRQPYTPAYRPVPTEAMPSLASGEALRRIIQPQPQPQLQPQYSTANPPIDQALSLGNNGVPPSQGQLIRRVPGSASPETGIPQTPGSTFGNLSTAPSGQAATGLSELTLVSPPNPLTGPRVGATPVPRPPVYGRPAAPAPSSSDSTTQKSRIDAIFAPQTQAAAGAATPANGDSGATLPAFQRVQDIARTFDMPAAILARSQSAAAGGAPSSATSGGTASDPHRPSFAGGSPSQPRLVVAGAPVQSDSDLANALQDLGGGASPSPTPASPVEPERALIAVEPPRQAMLSPGTPAPAHPFIPAGSSAAQTATAPPKSLTPAPKPPRVVLPPDTPFDRHMRAARLAVQQGQYARAAESFSRAATCNPKDVRPLLGRSHALFAAGEYLSSAVYLAKAIESDPRYVLQKSDLLDAAGGPDVFVQRITDLEKRAKAGNVPMLQLLLAYLYHQMNQSQQAMVAIQAARKGLPSSPSVDLLARAIAGLPPS
jgi:hypothetical protein